MGASEPVCIHVCMYVCMYVSPSVALCDRVFWRVAGGSLTVCVGTVHQRQQCSGGQGGHQDPTDIPCSSGCSWRCIRDPLPHLLGESAKLCSCVCDVHCVWLRTGSLEHCSCK